MRRLFIVRHGPTHAKSMVGWSDLPADLSDTSALQRLEAHFPSDAKVVSSDLVRTRTTADAIQGTRERLPDEPELREMHFGDWELKRFDEVEDQDRIRRFWEQPGDVKPPNGESWHQVVSRVDGAIDRLLASHTENLVVVAHFGVIVTQIQRALGLTAFEAFGHHIDNLSVTEFEVLPSRLRALSINQIL